VGGPIGLGLIHQFGFELAVSDRGEQRGLGTEWANRELPMVSQSASVASGEVALLIRREGPRPRLRM
jgi:hypothetical protein